MKIILNHAVQERRIILAPDTEIDKDDAEAQSMIARRIARAAPSESAAVAETSAANAPEGEAQGQTDGETPVVLSEADVAEFVSLNKAAALEAISHIPSTEKGVLRALLDVEQANKKRADVLSAIGAKLFPPVQD